MCIGKPEWFLLWSSRHPPPFSPALCFQLNYMPQMRWCLKKRGRKGEGWMVFTTVFAPIHKKWKSIITSLHNKSAKLPWSWLAKSEQFQGKAGLAGWLQVTVLSDHSPFFTFCFLGTPELIHAKQMPFYNRLLLQFHSLGTNLFSKCGWGNAAHLLASWATEGRGAWSSS